MASTEPEGPATRPDPWRDGRGYCNRCRHLLCQCAPSHDRIAELEAAVTRLTLALEMERGRGQPRIEVQGEVERLVRAVLIAEAVFDEYSRLHLAKGTADGIAKAKRNEQYADEMRAALSSPTGQDSEAAEHDRSFPDLGPSGEDEVERVARALCRELDSHGDTEAVEQQRVNYDWCGYEKHARIAIAALTPARTYAQGIEEAARCIEAGSKPDSYNRSLAKRIRSLGTKP